MVIGLARGLGRAGVRQERTALPSSEHRAGPALALAAAVLGAGQVQPVAQDREQALVRVGVDAAAGCR